MSRPKLVKLRYELGRFSLTQEMLYHAATRVHEGPAGSG